MPHSRPALLPYTTLFRSPGVDSGQQNQHTAGVGGLGAFVDVDKYEGLLVRLANWTAGGNNDFGVRGPAIRENPRSEERRVGKECSSQRAVYRSGEAVRER